MRTLSICALLLALNSCAASSAVPRFTADESVCLAAAEVRADVVILDCNKSHACIDAALDVQLKESLACVRSGGK